MRVDQDRLAMVHTAANGRQCQWTFGCLFDVARKRSGAETPDLFDKRAGPLNECGRRHRAGKSGAKLSDGQRHRFFWRGAAAVIHPGCRAPPAAPGTAERLLARACASNACRDGVVRAGFVLVRCVTLRRADICLRARAGSPVS
jgi:hypothetical protein